MILNKPLLAVGISVFCLFLPTAKMQAYPEQAIGKETLLSQQDSEAESSKLLQEAVQLYGENDAVSWQQAIAIFEKALVSLQKVEGDQSRGQGVILYMIGDLYSLLGEQTTALDYYQQALPLRKAAGDRAGEIATLSQIGSVYEHIGNSAAAIDYYQQALAVSLEEEDRDGQMSSLNSLGAVYSEIGETDTALSYYQQALVLAVEAENSSK